jgi:hypothetical protein
MTTSHQQAARRVTYQLETLWDYDYEPTHQELDTLYETAKKNQWNGSTAIDWSRPVGSEGPVLNVQVAFSGTNFFSRLTPEQQKEVEIRVSAWRLSQFLHGEQGALMTAAALTHAVPDYEGKLYAATQTMDEARHVEVYDRYIKKLAIIYPMSEVLKAVIDKTLQADRWVKIAIGMNMVVEGLALGAFQNMRRSTTCPLLREIVEGVLRDEARHVAFGNVYVKEAVAEMHQDEREDVADFAFEAIAAMRGRSAGVARGGAGGFDPGFIQVLQVVGIDPMDFMRGVMEAREKGIRVEPPADQVHAFRDLMMPALVRVGVVTDRVRERYAEAGIKIYEDQTVLRQMEGAT